MRPSARVTRYGAGRARERRQRSRARCGPIVGRVLRKFHQIEHQAVDGSGIEGTVQVVAAEVALGPRFDIE
jgi:hypothetical protein